MRIWTMVQLFRAGHRLAPGALATLFVLTACEPTAGPPALDDDDIGGGRDEGGRP